MPRDRQLHARKGCGCPRSFSKTNTSMTYDKTKKWTFTRDGVPEEVTLERWVWEARYADGSILRQFADDGVFHQIGEVDQTKIKVLRVSNIEGTKNIDILIPEGGKIIFKYRNYILNALQPNEQRVRIFVAGYQLGKKEKHLNFILPNDYIVQSNTEQLTLT